MAWSPEVRPLAAQGEAHPQASIKGVSVAHHCLTGCSQPAHQGQTVPPGSPTGQALTGAPGWPDSPKTDGQQSQIQAASADEGRGSFYRELWAQPADTHRHCGALLMLVESERYLKPTGPVTWAEGAT